jgi:hypothetical protein
LENVASAGKLRKKRDFDAGYLRRVLAFDLLRSRSLITSNVHGFWISIFFPPVLQGNCCA